MTTQVKKTATSAPTSKSQLLESKAKKVLIAIIVFSVVLLIAIVVISIVISFLRKEVLTASISFDVTDPEIWGSTQPICDPYDVTDGNYRLNFYSGASAFVHTIMIYEVATDGSDNTFLSKIIVPQDTPSSGLTYSYILDHAGTYQVQNFANGTKIGQMIFSYPNPCSLT